MIDNDYEKENIPVVNNSYDALVGLVPSGACMKKKRITRAMKKPKQFH